MQHCHGLRYPLLHSHGAAACSNGSTGYAQAALQIGPGHKVDIRATQATHGLSCS